MSSRSETSINTRVAEHVAYRHTRYRERDKPRRGNDPAYARVGCVISRGNPRAPLFPVSAARELRARLRNRRRARTAGENFSAEPGNVAAAGPRAGGRHVRELNGPLFTGATIADTRAYIPGNGCPNRFQTTRSTFAGGSMNRRRAASDTMTMPIFRRARRKCPRYFRATR